MTENKSYHLHDETAQLIVDGLSNLLAHEQRESGLPHCTDEWLDEIEGARGTLEAQNPELTH